LTFEQVKSPITTREIVIMAILSSLGGALSTFVGYLGNMINLALGVPFGAGQFMAGLHVFWLVLVRVLVPKKGAGTIAGFLKGFAELFTGSTHGTVIVIVSLVQGIIIDLAGMVGGDSQNANTTSRLIWWLGAGVSSASNVIVFQIFYFAGAPWLYIAVITILAFCSGIIFAGYFAWETLEFIKETGVIPTTFMSLRPQLPPQPKKRMVLRNLPAIVLVLFLSIGSIYYTVAVAKTFVDPYACEVTGLVEQPFTYHPSNFISEEVTIEAELQGAYTHIPPTNYTGILVYTILERSMPLSEASGLQVRARDGYTINFDLERVMTDNRFLLTETDDGLWLIAADYDGSLWVKQVTTLEIY
jgi:ABC-type thiamin/hydroxymethylpyrimidine transport system permease subunit